LGFDSFVGLSLRMDSVISTQLPQDDARPNFFLSLHTELAPLSMAARICVSVIALQIQMYIVFSKYYSTKLYLNLNENDCQYYLGLFVIKDRGTKACIYREDLLPSFISSPFEGFETRL